MLSLHDINDLLAQLTSRAFSILRGDGSKVSLFWRHINTDYHSPRASGGRTRTNCQYFSVFFEWQAVRMVDRGLQTAYPSILSLCATVGLTV